MNTLEKSRSLLRQTVLASAVASAILLSSGALAQTAQNGQNANANSMLAFVNSMKTVYKNTASSSGAAAATSSMNSEAMSDPLCTQLVESKRTAAQEFVKNKLPPDPTTAIQNSSCFLDVMDIKIPTTGFGFLDALIGALTPFLQSTACNKTANFWGDIKGKMNTGDFGGLTNQLFATAGAMQSGSAVGNSGGMITTYTQSILNNSGIPSGAINAGMNVANNWGNSGNVAGALGLPSGGQNPINGAIAAAGGNPQAVQPGAQQAASGNNLMDQVNNLRAALGLGN